MKRLIALLLSLAATPVLAAPVETPVSVKGLHQAAEIRIDTWGIAHIYAADRRDAFFLQGYNAARDRLWQIDLWRKRGLGLLARDFGPTYVAQDRAARLFLYRGDMAAEWAAYGPTAHDDTQAWVDGVNAFVGEIREGTRPLPKTFQIAATQPDLWTPEDVVRIRSHGLTRNAANEVGRAQIACASGLEATRLYRKLEPKWKTKVPEGLDPCAIPDDVLADYQLGTGGVKFTGPPELRAMAEVPPEAIGSNNWTVSGKRTDTGRPILSNDPHREHGAPSLRYIVHMEAPGFSVIGAGEPALPGVSIGHNGTIAFGLTIFPADQEDLYVYETRADDPLAYRYGDGWVQMEVVREIIEVKGQAPREVELRFTRHGPVLKEQAAGNRAFALKSVWSQPGTSAYFGSTGYMTAKTWPEFKAALADWGAPSENQVYADTSGNIGMVSAGRIPKRANWDGLMPVPGDGRYEWKGFLALNELPVRANPRAGWLASANAMNLPRFYPYAQRKVGFEWSNPSRINRINEVLAAKPQFSVADAMALQTDPTDVTLKLMRGPLQTLTSADPAVVLARDILLTWDGRTTTDSAGAALYETWVHKHLGAAAVKLSAPEKVRDLLGQGEIAAVMAWMNDKDSAALRNQILETSLAATMKELSRRLGPDATAWRWGDLHQARFEHALTPLADPTERAGMAAGPLPMAGTSLSPLAATWRPDSFRVTAGASFRMVLDVGAWDNSRTINTPGQSGEPDSAHFRDLFPLWARGDYVPLTYSRKAVEAVTEQVLVLSPARP